MALALAAGATVAPLLGAQSPNWSSALVIPPSPSPYLTDWERVPSTALLTLTYTGAGAVDFKVRVTLTSAERGLVGTTESPSVTLPGGPASLLYNVRDAVYEWTTVSRNSAVTDAAVKNGQIPEGNYRACARVLVGAGNTQATEACADFSILQPDPPQLLLPQDRSDVVSTQPVFQWTPMLAPPSVALNYEVTVVELLDAKQQPRAALESNIPVLRATTTAPFLLYPLDALPLERTKRYAWRVRAVDDAGRALFRDGAASEIWQFAMADELLKPVGRIADLPDVVDLLPGVARLVGLKDAKLSRTETEVTVDGDVTLEFLGTGKQVTQRAEARGLRLGFRGAELAALDGRIDATMPPGYLPADVQALVRFGPLVFTPSTGFQASATLAIPGATALPMNGTVQLTAGGLYGRLEGTGANGLPFARIGRAPVQYAATSARLTLPEGRLEVSGSVRLFEQEIGCPASGTMEDGIVRLPVYCDPSRGFRPDSAARKSLMTFGTLSGALGADFGTDTLGTDLRAPAMFTVFGESSAPCAITFTIVFQRDAIAREDERPSCTREQSQADFGWVRFELANLRLERLEYQPGRTLTWRALVDLYPLVKAAPNLNLLPIAGVRLDDQGVMLPSLGSEQPGTSANGLQTVDGLDFVIRTIGFKGGLVPYSRWLSGEDPGFEWGSGTIWVRYQAVSLAQSACLNAQPLEVDSLVIKAGRMEASLKQTDFEGGCRVAAAPNLHLKVLAIGGKASVALDSVARLVELPAIMAGAMDHRLDCGLGFIGCLGGTAPSEDLSGELHLNPYGRAIGRATGFAPSFRTFDLRFAKLTLTGGAFQLGVDRAGEQTAVYDGPVKVDFSHVDTTKKETKKEDEKKDETAAEKAASAAKAIGSLFDTPPDTVRSQVRLDWISNKLIGGEIRMQGPFTLDVGFVHFIIGGATFDTTGLNVDGRHKVIVDHTTATLPAADAVKKDTTYSSAKDTVGVTFARVRLDPQTGDLSAGTVTFDARVSLEASPFSAAFALGSAALGGAISGAAAGQGGAGDSTLAALGRTTSGTDMLGFTLVDAAGAWDPKAGIGGTVRLNLPSSAIMDGQGMRINGVARANVSFGGSRFDSASVSFENGFAMQPKQGRVTAGRMMVRVRQYPIAYLDASGWHLALAELAQTVIPDTLFLRDHATAFVVLKDSAHALRVEVLETNEGVRIRTRPGTPVRLVVPALKGNRSSAPSAEVAFDLTFERGTWRPLAGELRTSGAIADDFGVNGFPFRLDSLVLRASQDREAAIGAFGRLAVWPGEREPMRVGIELRSGGELRADVEQRFTDQVPLVEGSQLVKLNVDTLRFHVEGSLASGLLWQLELPSRLSYFDAQRQREQALARATFRLTATEAALVDFAAAESLTVVSLPGVDLRLGRVRAPTFRWDFATNRFDFELLFDVGLQIPAIDSLMLPEIRDVRITPQGMVIPAFELPAVPVSHDVDDPFADTRTQLRLGGFGVTALAYRVSEFRWNWFQGAPPPRLDFGVDLEFAIEDLPAQTDGQAARIAIRALNVGFTNGRFTGTFEPVEIPQPIRTPVADISGIFGSFRVADGEAPDIRIGVLADLRLPDVLACPDAAARYVPLRPGSDTLFMASNGTLRGSIGNLLPRCPMDLGPFDLAFGQSRVTFGYDPARQRADVSLDLAATLTVPGPTAGQTVSATGRIVLDVDESRLIDASLRIDRPFFWAPDPNNPFLRLVVDSASLTRDELRFAATGELRTEQGAGVDVAFDSVAFDLNTLALKSGRIRVVADAAIGVEIPDDGPMFFGVYPPSTPRGTTASARLTLPSGAIIDRDGVHITGSATAQLGFGGQDYASLTSEFANGFTINVNGQVGITRGRINLRDQGGQLIAYADSLGFWPGNVFAVLPIPARLGVPSLDVAYLQLRDPTDSSRVLVETEFGAETVRLHTLPNRGVSLVIPALAQSGTIPEVQVQFDLVLNARTMRPVSGGLLLEAGPGTSLIPLGDLPVQVTRLGFAADTGGWKLKAGAKAKLPVSLNGVDLEFRDIEVTAQGLQGTFELGHYAEVYDPALPAIVEARILGDTLTIAFTGAELTLAPSANVVKLSGGIRSSLLSGTGSTPRTIALAATIDATGFHGTASVSDPETPLPIGEAELTLENGANTPAIALTANAQEFALVLGGSVRLPSVAPGFSLGVQDLTISNTGIRVPNISVTAPANTREFELFGARFALRDSVVGTQQVAPAIGVQFDQGVFRFTLSGYITVLANTTRFIGLKVGTDGQFGLQGADFISKPIVIIDSVARLTRVAIVQNALELRGDVKLPAPFTSQAPQQIFVRIRPDGQVTGGGRINIINEAEGLANAQTKLSVGVAAFHLRRLDLELDFSTLENNAVSMVADIYIQEKQANLLRFGSVQGATVRPGLRVSAAGNVTFGGLTMPGPITLDFDPVKLTFSHITSEETPNGFAVDISGSVGLMLEGSGGSLAFSHVGFTSAGEVRLGTARIDGGTFIIKDVVKVIVGQFAFSDQDTSIYVPMARPPGANGEIQRDSVLVGVSTFLTLGASVDIAGAFAGGVDRLLVYVKSDDETTHFLIENLNVRIPGVLEFTANMSYDQLVDGFDMALSTEGLLLGTTRIGLVGVLGQQANTFRAGIFIRVSLPVPITIIPGIVSLTEVGGGLFINPRPSDLQLVKQVAGMNGPSANRVGMPPAGAFAVMLYAGLQVAGANGVSAAAGRALVTITDRAFQINATATFFRMDGQLTGDLALQVGWSPSVYVLGDVSLIVDIDSVVAGTASIRFFAGGGQFAVKGNIDLVVLTAIQTYAEVIVVPSGFTANIGFLISKSTNVVAVSFGANLRMWYRPSTNDLGAYLRLSGQVTVFGVTGGISLTGALVIQPELALYAQGVAEIVGVEALRLEVWVQYTSAGVAAGIGRNEELAAVLARAEQIAADLEAEANRILAGIDGAALERARTPIAVSDASLAAAYANFQRWNWLDLIGAWGLFRLGESGFRGGLLAMTASDPYVAFYERTLISAEAAADTALVRQLREEAAQKLQVINDRRAGVEQRIRELRLELDAAETAAQFIPPADPVLQWSSGAPAFVPGPALPDGRVVMVIANAPVFELDDQRAADAKQVMSAAQAANAARAPRLRAQLEAVEAGLATVVAATKASDANSFASYARVHSDLVEAVEHLHAANVDFRMRRRQWAQARIDSLATQRTALAQRLNDRLSVITAYQAQQSTQDRVRKIGLVRDLDTLAFVRVSFLSAWAKDPSILTAYTTEKQTYRTQAEAAASTLGRDASDATANANMEVATTFFTTQAVNYGMQTWWGVANAGLTAARDGAQQLVDTAAAQAAPVIRAMRDMHARITSDLDQLNARQAELVGQLYDLYDAYLRTYGSTDSIGQRYVARRAELAEQLRAPAISNPRVVVTDFGYLSSVQSTWTGTHPRGVYEYLMREGADSLLTIGAQGTARRWQFTTNQGGASIPQNQQLFVRGGAGFTGSVMTPYTVTFARGSAANPSSTVAVPPPDLTAPSAPIVEVTGLNGLPGITGEMVYWTGDSTRLGARWSASDPQSGVAQYEYRVLSWSVPTSSVQTLFAPGSGSYTQRSLAAITPVTLVPWTSVGGRTSATLSGLALPANRWIRVEARATNGAGLVGVEGASAPVQYDPTRPAFATGATTAPVNPPTLTYATVYNPPGFTPPLLGTCGSVQTLQRTTVKVWDGRLVTVVPDNGVAGGGSTYSVTMTRPDATDPETGVYGYNYRVDTVPPSGPVPADGWSDIVEATSTFVARSPLLVYGKPRWISLVAVNGAGARSQPLTYGPYQLNDITGPTAPAFCGDFTSGGFIAYMTTPSTDGESGVRGYQMRIRGPGGTVIRNFPSGTTVDWPASQANAGQGVRLAFAPTIGGQHIVDLRPVNGAGVVGEIASSGQVLVDVTAPPAPGVTASASGTRATVRLTLANDLESGLAGVDIAFSSAATDFGVRAPNLLMPYTTYASPLGISTQVITLDATTQVAEPLYVLVRVRNGAGLSSTVTSVRIR